MKKINRLLNNINPLETRGDIDTDISQICYDSRKITSNSLFIAIKGGAFDGHKFINSAIESGAVAIICEILPDNIAPNIAYIKVSNSRKALAIVANNFYDAPSKAMNLIGITGTNGKTTTTYLIKTIFEFAGVKTGVIGTTGIFIGDKSLPATHTTPESLELQGLLAQMKAEDVETVAMEISSHALCQNRVFGVNYSTAAFSNLTRDHLDYHKSMEEYACAKRLLFESLAEDSIAIVNADSDYADFMLAGAKSKIKISVGKSEKANVQIENVKLSLAGAEFDLNFKIEGEILHIKTKLIGAFNVDNAAIAAVIAKYNNIPNSAIISALSQTKGAPGRMERFDLKSGAIAFVDYAHTPDALEKALMACKNTIIEHSPNSKLISIFGCGGDRDAGKRPQMAEISERVANISIITNDNPRTEEPSAIINDIVTGLKDKDAAIIIEDRSAAISKAVQLAGKDDIILIAGKGHEDYQIIGTVKHFFSDAKELEQYEV